MKPDWISVNDRLPNVVDDVLVTVKESVGDPYVSIASYSQHFKEWVSPSSMGCGYDCEGLYGEITHWSELPSPAK